MADEQKKGICQSVRCALKVVVGIVLLAVGVLLVWLWRWDVLAVIKGFLGLAVILAGLVVLAIVKE